MKVTAWLKLEGAMEATTVVVVPAWFTTWPPKMVSELVWKPEDSG